MSAHACVMWLSPSHRSIALDTPRFRGTAARAGSTAGWMNSPMARGAANGQARLLRRRPPQPRGRTTRWPPWPKKGTRPHPRCQAAAGADDCLSAAARRTRVQTSPPPCQGSWARAATPWGRRQRGRARRTRRESVAPQRERGASFVSTTRRARTTGPTGVIARA